MSEQTRRNGRRERTQVQSSLCLSQYVQSIGSRSAIGLHLLGKSEQSKLENEKKKRTQLSAACLIFFLRQMSHARGIFCC